MSVLQLKKDFIKRGAFDELFTPDDRMAVKATGKEKKTISCNGYHGTALSKKYHAVRWGIKKLKEFKILNE